jgi:retron-type reverse transcriptase
VEAAAAAHGSAEGKKTFIPKLLPRTADSRNLRLAWDSLAAGDGQAPGVDGLGFHDLEDHDVWGLARTLHRAILDDTYRTAEDRQVRIPKASGKGYRTLSIPTVIDRVVQRAVTQVVQPYLDPFLTDSCLGYRPGSDVHKAVAVAEQLAVRKEAWVWVTEDLKNAFDRVPQRRLLDVIRRYIPDAGMMRLFERVVRTQTGMGLRQGGNLSPLLLNAYLHHFLDGKWKRLHPDVVLLRWADDVLILCRSREEANQAYQDLARLLLPAGMRLKGSPELAVHDLRDAGYADWLGYRLSQGENELKVSWTEESWTGLAERLELDHQKDGSPMRAVETILGWLSQMGPCLKTSNAPNDYTRIVSLAHNLAFNETPSQEEVRRHWIRAHQRWERCRERIGEETMGKQAGGSACRSSVSAGTCWADQAS